MPWFETSTESEATVPATPEAIWEVLTDPDAVARLTPLVEHIEADGDLWRWQMARVPVLGVSLTPAFTEHMQFQQGRRIDYTHTPPDGGREHAGVDGWYELRGTDRGTLLGVGLTVKVDLPLPRLSGPAVRTAMRTVMAGIGTGFSRNLLRHLGAE